MSQRANPRDAGIPAGKAPRDRQVPPRQIEKSRRRPAGPPAGDAGETVPARQAEPSEDFAQRDIETVDESPEQHDRRRHDRSPGDVESSQAA
ncbi:MAG TPA: hypothetical protein VHF87_03315 [Methylomirabilota bacterium]|jgi:hypothetical protein|nr:hypothetical protein [Methylomirabilota bacterium]